jgi:hypothetical protein
MYAARDEAAAAAFRARASLAELRALPLAERARAEQRAGPRPRCALARAPCRSSVVVHAEPRSVTCMLFCGGSCEGMVP